MEGWMWVLMDIVGPILLIGAIIWVFLRNRKPSRDEIERSERGARDLREQLNREDTEGK
jgi:hypothetical protein